MPRGRVLLAGDAAGLVDPLTGEGIHSAIVSGQAAAGAVLAAAGADAATLSQEYAKRLSELQAMLAFSYDAARSFYREPGAGSGGEEEKLLQQLMLKTYADGLPYAQLLAGIRAMARQWRNTGPFSRDVWWFEMKYRDPSPALRMTAPSFLGDERMH